jgi:nucleoside-diphosphate-sugar epimerase
VQKIAVIGGTGYLASIIKNQDKNDSCKYTFFSRDKNSKNYINYLKSKKINRLKNFDCIIHLAGPSQNELKKNKNLIIKKSLLTSKICDLCTSYNIKLIYISSLQVYKDYGKKNLSINSKIHLINPYSESHYESEKIILSKFLNYEKKFIILRMGNVFGFNKYNSKRDIDTNLIHSLCFDAFKKKTILINNGSIQRSFIPSQIFVYIINSIIKKNLFNNSIENVPYKNLHLKEVALIIQKRIKSLFKFNIKVKIEKFVYKKKYKINSNKNLKFNINNKLIYFEMDQVLKYFKKNN